VNNAARHGACRSVSIHVAIDGRSLLIDITDDGRGFDQRATLQDGDGLASMQRRAARLGGALEVTSAAGAGTRVHATIPMRPRSLLPQ
jgi:signal transduction histidine kinase